MYERTSFVVCSTLIVALTPTMAAADSLPLVVLNLAALSAVVWRGITIHKQLKKGTN